MRLFSPDDIPLIIAAWVVFAAVLVAAAIVSARMFTRRGAGKGIAVPCSVGISASLASLPLVAGCWYTGSGAIAAIGRDEAILFAVVCVFLSINLAAIGHFVPGNDQEAGKRGVRAVWSTIACQLAFFAVVVFAALLFVFGFNTLMAYYDIRNAM